MPSTGNGPKKRASAQKTGKRKGQYLGRGGGLSQGGMGKWAAAKKEVEEQTMGECSSTHWCKRERDLDCHLLYGPGSF